MKNTRGGQTRRNSLFISGLEEKINVVEKDILNIVS